MQDALRPRASKLEILEDRPGELRIGAYGNLNLTLWLASATAELANCVDRTMARWVPCYAEGVSTMQIITQTAGPPRMEARDALVATMRRWQAQIGSMAVVVERDGFGGSALRSAVTGILMLVRSGYPMQVHGSQDEAVLWLAGHHLARTGVQLLPGELEGVLREFRPVEARGKVERNLLP